MRFPVTMRLAQDRRRGVALLLSLAILAVLAILATTFTRLMIMEHNAATNYVAAARADALANAGLDYALGQLRLKSRNQHWSWFSEGFGTTSTGTADVPTPAQRWIYKMRVVDGAPANFYETLGAGLPLEFAVYPPGIKSGTGPHIYGGPSFYKGNTAVDDSTDVILGTYPAGETAEYEVYSAKIAAKGRGQAISGWIGGSLYTDGPQSKFIAGTYENWGDTFRVKCLDCSSMVNINMDTSSIEKFVDLLGEEVDNFWRERPTKTGDPLKRSAAELKQFGYRYPGLYILTHLGGKGLGEWLIDIRNKRPNKVFLSKDEILSELRNELGTGTITVGATTLRGDQIAREDYNKLKDFITCYGWRDVTVLEPQSLMTAQIYSIDAANGQFKEARTPINMNTVSNPVLTAWLRGISYNKYEEEKLAKGSADSVPVSFESKFGAARLRKVAFKFRRMTYFTPILAWKGMESVLQGKSLVESQAGDITANKALRDAFLAELDSGTKFDEYDRDAWLAMADPNATLNKWNPDALVRRVVDKYDLDDYTTEMSFNSMGYFEIYSLGTVTNGGGAVIADRKIRGVYQVYDVVYKTTQRDFEIARLKVGRDVAANKDVALHVGNWWGITTLPEYRTKYLEYREKTTGTGKYDTEDPTKYGYVALYDGTLVWNTLDKRLFFKDDFGAGFSYPLFKNPESGKNALDGIRPVGIASKQERAAALTDDKWTPAEALVPGSSTLRRRMAKPTSDPWGTSGSTGVLKYDKSAVSGEAAALKRFHDGSDVFPMGFYSDSLRKRTLAYRADLVKGGNNGAIQFWVKPRFKTAPAGVRESWFYWEDKDEQKIWVYREGAKIYFWFSIGTLTEGKLEYDTTLDPDIWGKPGRWHHIHLDWGRSGRIFVNGKEATGGGYRGPNTTDYPKPEARHLEFGGWPPETAEAMRTFEAYPTKYKSAIEWVERHIPRTDKRYTYAKAGSHLWIGYGVPAKDPTWKGKTDKMFANATIDNVIITTWRIYKINQVEMPHGKLPFRYYPRTYHDPSRFYWQDISPHFSGYSRDIALGTLAWTNWHTDRSFVRVYLQIEDLDAQEAVAG